MPDDLRLAALDHPFAQAPAPGAATKVAEGIYWIRMPLPFALDHINLWLLEDGDGWTIVDTGLGRDETRDLWRTHFTQTMSGKPVKRIIVTHFHPDHIGNAGWLAAERQAPVWITRTEWMMHQMLMLDDAAVMHRAQIDAYRQAGLGDEWITPLLASGNTYQDRAVRAPTQYVRLRADDEIEIGGRVWRILIGTGHAPEHACLHCPSLNLLISGDQILPKITPNISLWANDMDGDPLGDYLNSLPQFKHLPADTLVLPSHRLPFIGLHLRVDQLHEHHAARLDDIIAACKSPMTATAFLPVLFKRQLDLHQIGFAMGEGLAHLNHLARQGKLVVDHEDEGVATYRPASS